MEAQSQWYKDILREVDSLAGMLDPREARRYRLSLVGDVSGRVDTLAASCLECQLRRQELTDILAELHQAVTADGRTPDRTRRKDFQKRFAAVIRHLEKKHQLVPLGHYQAIWLAIGPGIGIVIGMAMDNTAIGIAVGAGIGLAVGSALDARARREDRVIGDTDKDQGLNSPQKTRFLVIAGLVLALVALVAGLRRGGLF